MKLPANAQHSIAELVAARRKEFEPFVDFMRVERPVFPEPRPHDWLSGFHQDTIIYAKTNTWDKHELKCYMLIPKAVDKKKEIPFHVVFHGGGLCTGGGLLTSWYTEYRRDLSLQENAITLIPNYRLMPEADGEDIEQDIRDWWDYYRSNDLDDCVKHVLARHKLGSGETLQKDRLLISGESAGGLLAVNTWLTEGKNLPIKAIHLQYPMLKYLKRTPDKEGNCFYMGKAFSYKTVELEVHEMLKERNKLRERGEMVSRSDSRPPCGMAASNGLAYTNRWKEAFMNGKGTMDVPTRLKYMAERNIQPAHFPRIFITHGDEDDLCLIEDTEEFVNGIRALWVGYGLQVTFEKVRGKGHGFDYLIGINNTDDNPWLKRIIQGLKRAW